MKKTDVLVVGSANVDMVVNSQRIPLAGETLLGGVFACNNGGKGANQAWSAAALCKTAFCGAVGGDVFGREYVAHLKKRNIDVSNLKIVKGTATGVALIVVAKNGENIITVASGANEKLLPSDIRKINFKNYSVVLFQLESPLKTVKAGIDSAKKAGCITVLTPAPAMPLPNEILKNVDFLMPNEHEILLLQKKRYADFKEAAKSLLKKGVKNVVITLGKKGCLLVNKNGEKFFKALKVKAVDTVGAGDCFTGSFAAALTLFNYNTENAIELAIKAAAESVTKRGAQPE